MRSVFRAPHPLARLAPLGVTAACGLALCAWAARDAHARRAVEARDGAVRALAAAAVGPELALHAGSRWLRHPTRSEPWAAGADAPAMLDLDPAGALAPPPVAVLTAGLPRARLAVRRQRR